MHLLCLLQKRKLLLKLLYLVELLHLVWSSLDSHVIKVDIVKVHLVNLSLLTTLLIRIRALTILYVDYAYRLRLPLVYKTLIRKIRNIQLDTWIQQWMRDIRLTTLRQYILLHLKSLIDLTIWRMICLHLMLRFL